MSSNERELSPQMRVVHFGKVLKRTCDGTGSTYHERYCVVTYGIWCYFTSPEKAQRFLDSLPWSRSTNRLTTKEEHRKAFKGCLKLTPPRGYIKLLNRDGKPVSTVDLSYPSMEIHHNGRTFYLRSGSAAEFQQWLSVFRCLTLNVQIDQNAPQTANNMQGVGMSEWTLNGDISATPSPEKPPPSNTNNTDTVSTEHCLMDNGKNIDYDEEDARLLNESKRLEQLLNQDRDKILSSFAEIRKSIKTEQ